MTDVPEAIVKLVGYGRSAADIESYLKKISVYGGAGIGGGLKVELNNGAFLHDNDEIKELVGDWSVDFHYRKDGKARNTINLILSAPKGSYSSAVFESARLFGIDVFGENFEYIMVFVESCHTGNPHVHFVVKAVGRDLSRFTINPDDFYQMRKIFAHHCSENGVPMKAT